MSQYDQVPARTVNERTLLESSRNGEGFIEIRRLREVTGRAQDHKDELFPTYLRLT